MPFQTRNAYYLRISKNHVLPLYLYLDERHLDWMSDRTLQHVLADLRPRIFPKITAEASILFGGNKSGTSKIKQSTVDVHKGDSYQFAFFFRKTEPHSVVIKTRTFIAAPQPTTPEHAPPAPTPSAAPKNHPAPMTRKRKLKGKARAREWEDEDVISLSDSDEDLAPQVVAPRHSTRARKVVTGGYRQSDEDESSEPEVIEKGPAGASDDFIHTDAQKTIFRPAEGSKATGNNVVEGVHEAALLAFDDIEMAPPPPRPPPPPPTAPAQEFTTEIDEEENKLKPLVQLRYEGFNIWGQCLCVIVEPWPPVRANTRAPSVAPPAPRAPSIAPADYRAVSTVAEGQRPWMPLFLPDEFERERSEAPATRFGQQRQGVAPASFNDYESGSGDEDDDEAALMVFSQVLNAGGALHAGGDDDDDLDGAAFLGDADDAREF